MTAVLVLCRVGCVFECAWMFLVYDLWFSCFWFSLVFASLVVL